MRFEKTRSCSNTQVWQSHSYFNSLDGKIVDCSIKLSNQTGKLQNSMEAIVKLKMFSRLKLQWLHRICNSFLMWKRNKGGLCFP